MIYMNFLRENTAQNGICSSLLPRSRQEHYKEIYFTFFYIYMIFYKFWEFK
jgi:hypothetical protein